MLYGITLLVLFFVFLVPATYLYAAWRAVPWVPTKAGDMPRLLALMKLRTNDTLYDLGCGDGRLLSLAHEEGARAVGFEISLLHFLISWLRVRLFCHQGSSKPSVQYRDFWHTHLGDATVVYFFLIPRIMLRLKEKFERELKPGTKVISYMWPIPGWEPLRVDVSPDRPKIYVYQR